MVVMFEDEKLPKDESEIPPKNEEQESLVEETEKLMSSQYPQVTTSYDILDILEEK